MGMHFARFLWKWIRKSLKIMAMYTVVLGLYIVLAALKGIAQEDHALGVARWNLLLITAVCDIIYFSYHVLRGRKPGFRKEWLLDIAFYITQFGLFHYHTVRYYHLNHTRLPDGTISYAIANRYLFGSGALLTVITLLLINRLFSAEWDVFQPRKRKRDPMDSSPHRKIFSFGMLFSVLFMIVIPNLFLIELDAKHAAAFYLPFFIPTIMSYENLTASLYGTQTGQKKSRLI